VNRGASRAEYGNIYLLQMRKRTTSECAEKARPDRR
jgi:hypothetical protein